MLHQPRQLALLILVLLTLRISAQSLNPASATAPEQRGDNTPVQLFAKTTSTDASAARFAQGAQFLLLDDAQLAALLAEQPKKITLTLPFNQEVLTIDLIQTDITAADFKVLTGQSTVEISTLTSGLHYRGVLRESAQSIAAFSFFENEVMGLVSDEQHGNLVLGKVQKTRDTRSYMLYADSELAMDNPFECRVFEAAQVERSISTSNRKTANRALRIALEADYALFKNRSGLQSTVNYLAGIFNAVSVLFANEQITVMMSQVTVWDTPDPYSVFGAQSVLEQFRTLRSDSDADLVHLVGLYENNPESAAYLDALCSNGRQVAYSGLSVSYSRVPTYSWAAEVMAHEIGHNLGARHTQWCGWPGGAIDQCQMAEHGCAPGVETSTGSTVMSFCPLVISGINFSKGFGPLPGAVIRDRVASATCLAPIKKIGTPAIARTNKPQQSTMDEGSLRLAPNPAADQVNVEVRLETTNAASVNLLDITGRPLQTRVLTQRRETVEFDLSKLPKGVYLVQILEGEKMVAMKRLVKN